MNSVTPTNNMTPNEMNIVSRVLLQKILASDAAAFLSKDCCKRINEMFLASNPEKSEIKLTFRTAKEEGYYSTIADITMMWISSEQEIQDLSGNVWVPHHMKTSMNISSSYGNNLDAFKERATAIGAMMALLDDLKELISSPVKVMTLTDTQRDERDRKRAYDAACQFILKLITADRNSMRRQLRAGGRGRPVPRSKLPTVSHGRFEVEINDGSKRRPVIRKYVMIVPENPEYLALLKRIA